MVYSPCAPKSNFAGSQLQVRKSKVANRCWKVLWHVSQRLEGGCHRPAHHWCQMRHKSSERFAPWMQHADVRGERQKVVLNKRTLNVTWSPCFDGFRNYLFYPQEGAFSPILHNKHQASIFMATIACNNIHTWIDTRTVALSTCSQLLGDLFWRTGTIALLMLDLLLSHVSIFRSSCPRCGFLLCNVLQSQWRAYSKCHSIQWHYTIYVRRVWQSIKLTWYSGLSMSPYRGKSVWRARPLHTVSRGRCLAWHVMCHDFCIWSVLLFVACLWHIDMFTSNDEANTVLGTVIELLKAEINHFSNTYKVESFTKDHWD